MRATEVAIVIPTLNEERCICETMAAFTDCAPSYRVVVVDGGSSDRTRQLVLETASHDPRVSLLENPGRIQSVGVNLAVRELDAQTRVVIRADAHCIYPRNFVATLVEAMETSGADSVVVPMRTIGEGALQGALAALQNSRLGNGGAAHRHQRASGFVDHGHHAAFRRDRFESLGGYDESFSHNEDAEYDIRLLDAGGRIWMSREAEIGYLPRRSFTALARQYFSYGRGRAKTWLKHRKGLKVRQLAPIGVLVWNIMGVAGVVVTPLSLLMPALYAGICLLWSGLLVIRTGRFSGMLAAPAAVIIHVSWALGFLSRLPQVFSRKAH